MNCIDEKIKCVWVHEQDILDVIDTICKKNGLRYSLAYGTLLGAVRHSGFIPWDDDIDIMMPREDYNILLDVWNKEAPKNYILQNYYTDSDFTQNFSKIRKNNTTFLQSESEREKNYHKGIFVDVFPGDRVAPQRIKQAVQYIACAINLLYSRGYTSGTGGLVELVEQVLLLIKGKTRSKLRDMAAHVMQYWNDKVFTDYIFASTISSSRMRYPASTFDDLERIEFNEKAYFCTKEYKKILSVQYGDYMKFPPEEERVWKHHPILIDFSHNYEELVKNERE